MTLYPLEPLAEALGIERSALARRLGISGSTWKQYRDQGVTEKVADRLAVRAGLHPSEVWPEIVDEWISASSGVCPECGESFVKTRSSHRFCSDSCRRRPAQRRYYNRKYQTDPEFRQKEKDRASALYYESHAYALRRNLAYKQANRERINAAERARKAAKREAA